MKRYAALLRGINISGKNKIPMPELKKEIIGMGYENVMTYLNSGNVIFSTEEEKETVLADKIRRRIYEAFGLDIPVFVIALDYLRELLEKAPEWWGSDDKSIYDNLIFVMPPADAISVSEKIGAPSEELEQIQITDNCIFWSFDRQKYGKANWWKKTATPGITEDLTIRTANTLRTIVQM